MSHPTMEVNGLSADASVAIEPAAACDVAATQHERATYIPAGSGPAYWGPGSLMTFLVTGRETGGAFFVAEMTVPPGGGPPPHVHHREDESFYVLEGSLTVHVGGDTLVTS